jgi:hypothetical protein
MPLVSRAPTVFLDKFCLVEGEAWQNGFLNGLINAALIVLVVSDKVCPRCLGVVGVSVLCLGIEQLVCVCFRPPKDTDADSSSCRRWRVSSTPTIMKVSV